MAMPLHLEIVQPPLAYASPGFRVANASASPWDKMHAGVWEPYTFELLDSLLISQEHPVFVDIGAFVGPLSLYAASLNATVFAAEADVENFALLLKNIRENSDGLRARISSHLLAVSNVTGVARMSKPSEADSPNSAAHKTGSSSAVSILETIRSAGAAEEATPRSSGPARQWWTVPSMALPLYLQELLDNSGAGGGFSRSRPFVVSMDIEGAESEALQAAFAMVAAAEESARPPLILEMHPGFFPHEGGGRARYVASTCRVLALYRKLYFLGRDHQPRCDAGQKDHGRSNCHWPAVLAEFESVHSVAAFMMTTTQDAFMLHAIHSADQHHRPLIYTQVEMPTPQQSIEDAHHKTLADGHLLNIRTLYGVSLPVI